MSTLGSKFKKASESESRSVQEFLYDITDERRDLSRDDFYIPPYGNSAVTLITKDEVFKQGRDWDGTKALKREYDILQTISSYDLPVPKPTYIGKKTAFIGMNYTPAVTLRDIAPTMTMKEKARFGRQLGEAKAKLEVCTRTASTPFLPNYALEWDWDLRAGFEHTLEVKSIEETLSNLPQLKGALERYVESVEERDSFLLHCDMHGANILVDPKTKNLAGLIDFGSAHHSILPERDFIRLDGDYYDQDIVTSFIGAYSQNQPCVTLNDTLCHRFLLAANRVKHYIDSSIDAQEEMKGRALQIDKALGEIKASRSKQWVAPFLRSLNPDHS